MILEVGGHPSGSFFLSFLVSLSTTVRAILLATLLGLLYRFSIALSRSLLSHVPASLNGIQIRCLRSANKSSDRIGVSQALGETSFP